MKILIAFECSGVVRSAFRQRGHDAWSCDLQPAYDGGEHIQADAFSIIDDGWDMMIAHPPCTYLAVSGNRWYAKSNKREAALVDIQRLMECSIEKWAIENPVSVISSRIRKPDQTIQPWQFGHGETKRTCLWLSGLPKLKATNVVDGREQRIWKMSPSADRQRLRSITYSGIADAMAEQWSSW